MKKLFIYLSLLPLLSLIIPSAIAEGKSPKRGVSENQFSVGSMLDALEPGVSWYYNWGNIPGKGYQNQVIDHEGLEYVPMCWNANYNADNIREYVKAHPTTKYLLGFNEPNFTKQANMTPQQAAAAWPAVKALADELGLKLVAPALNYSPNPPYTDPLKWMDEFVALVGTDAFDYTAVHNYGGLTVMKRIAGDFHERYGKDVWVTEFCLWPNEGDPNSTVLPSTQIASMTETLEWLETTPWIFRYAWFKPVGNSNAAKGPNYGLLVHEGSGTDPWTLSEQGKVYVHMPEFDENNVLGIEKWHPAASYFRSSAVVLGSTNDAECESPIHISAFSAGAYADYKFDIPEDGDWYLHLRVGGFGEPTRFDPKIAIYSVNEAGEEKELSAPGNFSLPGTDFDFFTRTFPLSSLSSGQIVLRVRDAAPYQPSGITISGIMLSSSAEAAAEMITNDENAEEIIYNLQGIRVEEPLEHPGLYIINGKKVRK